MNDLISVIMGIKYNQSELDKLKRSIDSILNQTYSDFELLICERGSSSMAREELRKYAEKDSRIKLIDGSMAGSFSEQLNICIEHSKGKWIARMDDDDYSYPERFAEQLSFLMAHEEIAFVGCNVILIQDNVQAGIQKFPEKPSARDFLFSMPYIHPALMFRRHALEAVGGYSTLPRCNRCEDYDLLLRLYEKGLCGFNIQEPLFAYTLPSGGITTRGFKDRVNEMRTRAVRFYRLHLFPGALIYTVKPLVLFMLPKTVLAKLKRRKMKRDGEIF